METPACDLGAMKEPHDDVPGQVFATTDWSLVLNAATDSGEALNRLCRAYWRPIYLFVRRSGYGASDAEDITQEFFVDILRREWIKLANRELGSFRAFLRADLRHFLNNRWRRDHRQKRGGGEVQVPLETEGLERELASHFADTADPTVIYDRKWAVTVLQAAMARLEEGERRGGRMERFVQLRPFVGHPPATGDYERLAKELATSQGHVALLVHRLSRRFAGLVRVEIAATVADPSEIDAELEHLLRSVSR
jgi:DNA-directed RNA polymerase specialized sigma24 family protein